MAGGGVLGFVCLLRMYFGVDLDILFFQGLAEEKIHIICWFVLWFA